MGEQWIYWIVSEGLGEGGGGAVDIADRYRVSLEKKDNG